MDKLTNLRVVTRFVVGIETKTNEKENVVAKLKDLKAFRNIRGRISIEVGENYRIEEDEMSGNTTRYLKSMENLRELEIHFLPELEFDCAEQEAVLDRLEPPPNVKVYDLLGYKGKRIGGVKDNWAISLWHLVSISIVLCENLEQIPTLSQLPNLKKLSLWELYSVEYMEGGMSSSTINNNGSDKEAAIEFFPSLEYLEIEGLPKLKGWWKGAFKDMALTLVFPHLCKLKIDNCPNLISFAPSENLGNIIVFEFPRLRSLDIKVCPNLVLNVNFPSLKELHLERNSERLPIIYGNWQVDDVKLSSAYVDKVSYLKSLPTNSLTNLTISDDSEMENLLEVKETFKSCPSSLKTLNIYRCKKLKTLLGLEHFTALETLELSGNLELSICEEDEEPWKLLSQSLTKLEFSDIRKMKSLPMGLQLLTSLQSLRLSKLPLEGLCYLPSLKFLEIYSCTDIHSLPDSIKGLTSLKQLSIIFCDHLIERCKNPNGEDFHKIQHIPVIYNNSERIS